MEPVNITIALEDESRGYAISPKRVPLSLLSAFTSEVQTFIRGADKEIDAAEIDVSVVEGSLALAMPAVFAPSLTHDLRYLQHSSDLSRIDQKRRSVMERWQSSARHFQSRVFKISLGDASTAIIVDNKTDFRAVEVENWIAVERYIQGELMDLGGSKESNAHIKLPNGKTLTVRTNKDQIRSRTDNMVYRVVHLRIRAEYNLDSGELRNPQLIEFVNYSPKFDAEAFERLTGNGAEAWKDVDDPARWVRQLRGSDE